MKLVGIDVGKNSHHFCVMDKETGEFNVTPSSFSNNKEGFDFLINSLKPYSKKSILIGMEDTGHYHVALLKFLLSNGYTVALINPKTTDLTRKMEGGITKNDKLDTITICPTSLLISLFIYLRYFESSTDRLLIREPLPDLGLLGKIECLLLVGFEYLALGQIALVGHQVLVRLGAVGGLSELFGIRHQLRFGRVLLPADPNAVIFLCVDLPVMLRRIGWFRLLVEDHLFVSKRDQFVRTRVADQPVGGPDCCRGVLQTPVDQFCVVVHCFRFI